MTRPRHPISFIATDDPGKAQRFYTDVLSLTLRDCSPFALVYLDGQQMLRVQIVGEFAPPPYTVHGWQVEDIEAEIRMLTAKGVDFQQFNGLPQDDFGIWHSPNSDKIAWFKDPSGNTLSLTQFVTP